MENHFGLALEENTQARSFRALKNIRLIDGIPREAGGVFQLTRREGE